MSADLELADWRRRVAELYAAVRPSPTRAAATPAGGRGATLCSHPSAEPAAGGRPAAGQRLAVLALRPGAALRARPAAARGPGRRLELPTGEDGEPAASGRASWSCRSRSAGRLTVWWLEQYAGGLFVPLQRRYRRPTSYGGGRYLLDTAKGADLGGGDRTLVLDLNFLYHPSCRYDAAWLCPLAPPDNTIAAVVEAGERLG